MVYLLTDKTFMSFMIYCLSKLVTYRRSIIMLYALLFSKLNQNHRVLELFLT